MGGADLLSASAPTNAVPTLNLEAIPNRDSTPYQEAYGLQDAHTVYRGTVRARGRHAPCTAPHAQRLCLNGQTQALGRAGRKAKRRS